MSILVKKFRRQKYNLTLASYIASCHISHHGKAHIVEEFIVKPTLIDVASCIFEDKSTQVVESISLSYNTV